MSDYDFFMFKEHQKALKDLNPKHVFLISATIVGNFMLYIGNEYRFFSFYIILQSLILLLLFQFSTSFSGTTSSTSNVFPLAMLNIIFIAIIIYDLKPFDYESSFTVLNKFLLLIYILLFSQESSSTSNITLNVYFCLFIYTLWTMYDYISLQYITRSE